MTAPLMTSGFGQFHTNEAGRPNRKPYVQIGLAEIRKLVDSPQTVDKASAQWLIPSTLLSRSHKTQAENGEFWLLWGDVDSNPPPLQYTALMLDQFITNGCQFEVYTSRSATVDRQKCRILIPLAEPVSGADWVLCQQVLNDKLKENDITPDPTNEGAGQLCYLPNRGEFYASESVRAGPMFQPLVAWSNELAALRQAQEEKRKALEAKRQAASEKRAALTEADTAGNLIQVFNEAFPVEEILLRAGYDQADGRFRHPRSESGSFSASVKDGRVHSLSSSDPLYSCGQGAHDSFSAFSTLYCGGDNDLALQLAGDQWLAIGSESWNAVQRREYARRTAQERAGAGFDTISVGEHDRERFKLLTPSELSSLPAVQWLVKGVLPQEGIAAIYGPPGSGKSFLTLDLLGAVSAGRNWFGCRTEAAPVIYVGLEGEAGVSQRVKAYEQVHGPLPENFRAILEPLDVRRPADRAALVDAIRESGMGGGLLVIDTLNQSTPGMDENDSAAMGLAIAGVKAVQRELGGLVLLVHHSGKDASKGLRGHSSLLAALDASIEVCRDGDDRGWQVGKSKDGVDGNSHAFTLETIAIGVDDDLTEVTSCVIQPANKNPARKQAKAAPSGGNQKIALAALRQVFRGIAEQAGWEDAERPRILFEAAVSEVANKLPVEPARKIERAKSLIAALVAKNLFECSDGFLLPC